ncbi:LacI family DNA-binding transcriptional regulator [Bacillus sp. 179-C3.3 HS]|uniref:LacI family DNA-binding transcriptional regulator n=1 Tax=Bacillus sp. 179-C3.3 HS TaxID=3232162 RepID=UPI0039A0F70B
MTVTIKDIAKLANVSHTTVSRALNNSPFIKEKTRQKILSIAKQLNYSPNVHARGLVSQKSFTIGLFFTSLTEGTSSSFFVDALKGVNRVMTEHYNMFVRGIDDFQDYTTIHKQRYDGILLMSQSEHDEAFIHHVKNQGIPIIVLNRRVESEEVMNILADDSQGAYQAAHFFIQQGHKEIAMIEGKEGFKSTQERKAGFLQALIDHHVPMKKEYMIKGDYHMKSGFESMGALLALEHPPTALFCSNDDMAIGAINALYAKGKTCPDDMSIIGFDDIAFSSYTTPALTTVKKPIEKMCALGAEALFSVMNGEKKEEHPQKVYVHTELMMRDSVKKVH